MDAAGHPSDSVGCDDSGWYVLRCKPREDARAVEHLGNQGFEAFAPECLVTRRVGTVRRKQREPMFPGYAFVRLSSTRQDWSVLRSTRGVMQLVRFGSAAPRVPQTVVDELRRLDGLDLDAKAATRLKPGDGVRVLDGPFAGLQGVYAQREGMLRACVLLECMQQQVRVTVPDALLEAVNEPTARPDPAPAVLAVHHVRLRSSAPARACSLRFLHDF